MYLCLSNIQNRILIIYATNEVLETVKDSSFFVRIFLLYFFLPGVPIAAYRHLNTPPPGSKQAFYFACTVCV